MKKFISIFISSLLFFLSTSSVFASASTSTRDIKTYSINELESVFTNFCVKHNISDVKNKNSKIKFLREFLLNENYDNYDINDVKLIRAYAAIYLNEDFLTANFSKINKKRNSDIKALTINDINTYTEQEDMLSISNARFEPRYVSGYLPQVAVRYAYAHAYSPNSNFYDFTRDGGDCTNFVSQALSAGGIRQVVGSNYGTNGWFYKSANNRSSTWTGAHQFGNYWRPRVADYSGRYKSDIIPKASAGDIIQYKEGATGLRYHSVFVINNLGNDLTIAQRTDNYTGTWSGRGGIPNHNGYETYFDLLKFGY